MLQTEISKSTITTPPNEEKCSFGGVRSKQSRINHAQHVVGGSTLFEADIPQIVRIPPFRKICRGSSKALLAIKKPVFFLKEKEQKRMINREIVSIRKTKFTNIETQNESSGFWRYGLTVT